MILIKHQNNTNVNLLSKYYYYSYIFIFICIIIIAILLFKLYYKKEQIKQQRCILKEGDILINEIVYKLIYDIDKLKLLFAHFIIPININNTCKKINIENIKKEDCKIKLYNDNNEYYDLYQLNKIDYNNNCNNRWLQKFAKKYIINKDNDIDNCSKYNKDKITEWLLILHEDIKNFVNLNKHVHTIYTDGILQYIFKKYSNCDHEVIVNLSRNIVKILFYLYNNDITNDNNDINNCIKQLFIKIKNDDSNIFHRLCKLEILFAKRMTDKH